jgi:hypothetical protein
MAFAKHAFLITIDNSDNRGAVVSLIRGAGSVFDLIEERDVTVIGGENVVGRYVLKPSLCPLNDPEYDMQAWVGINAGVPAVVRNEYSQNTILWRTIEFGNVTLTRAQMIAQTKLQMIALGLQFAWELKPGDSLTIVGRTLLDKFVALS